MLPLIARATQEVLALVPGTLREGALALGASRWRTVLGVVLPTSLGGILTGTVLAVARAAGETAPLLFTTSIAANAVTWDPRQPVLSIPYDIFVLSESPDPADHARAWALGFVLICFVLVTSLSAPPAARPIPKEAGGLTMEADTMNVVAPIEIAQPREAPRSASDRDIVFETRALTVSYGKAPAVSDVDLSIYRNLVTAIIGPSGCGKSTFLRSLNRMNDLVPSAKIEGEVLYHGQNIYGDGVDPVEVRAADRDGLPEAESVPEVDLRQRRLGPARPRDEGRSRQPRRARANAGGSLWDEVSDRLKKGAFGLSGGQQQRLCIARAIAVEPDVVLLDEPASALDPIATSKIEDLMHELKNEYTLVIVTHNMQQAARVADMTAFFTLERTESGGHGVLVEYDETPKIFTQPSDKRTEGYVTGRFG